MKDIKTAPGIVIVCNSDGIIIKTITDELGIADNFPRGKLFSSCFIINNLHSALDFIVAVKNAGTAHSNEMNIIKGDIQFALTFAGALIDENIVIVASKSKGDTEILFTEIMGMNNELINTLRSLYKQNTHTLMVDDNKSSLLYDELSGLNNELINMQREIARENAELEKLNNLKDQFLGMAAHDLRNPLGLVRSFSELLEEESSGFSKDHLEIIQDIHSLSSFMLGLVNDLLDISSIDSGNLNLDLANIDLIALIHKALTFNRIVAYKKNISIDFITTLADCMILIDPNKVNQVLTNLLTNAIKYSYPDTKVQVTLIRDERFVTISVKDEGQGIPADELPKLFGAFQRTSVRSTDGERSTGLGLLISKKMVEGHGGKIWVESKVGAGSTFYFTLPNSQNLER